MNSSWPCVPIQEFAEVVTGGTPSTLVREYWENGNIPWLNSGELNKGVIFEAGNYITESALKNSAAQMMPENTVLVALTGATTGISALLKIKACGNQSVTGILPSNKHDPHFLLHYLRLIRSRIVAESWGGAQKHISQAYVKQLKVPFPRLQEQRRIAAILDKADELRAKRRNALTGFASLSQAIFFDLFGDPRQNQAEWPTVPLGELCAKLVDGCHKTPTYVESGVPFITVSNIVSGTLDFEQTKFISQAEHAVLTKRVKPGRGDILVSKDGTIGVPCPIETDREFSIFVSVALLKIKHQVVDQIFLTKQLETDWIQSQIKAGTKGIAIRHLHLNDFKRLRILLPPLPLQKEFVHRISAVENLRAAHLDSLAEMDALFASLQHRAFRGEL